MSSDIPNKLSGNERSNSKRFTNCNSVSEAEWFCWRDREAGCDHVCVTIKADHIVRVSDVFSQQLRANLI